MKIVRTPASGIAPFLALSLCAAGFTFPTIGQVCTSAPPGLVSWWQGQDDARDGISTNHGVLMNGATFAAGKVGQGFSLNGSGQYVRVPNSPALSFSNALTLEFWYKQATPGFFSFIAKRDPGAGTGPCNFGFNGDSSTMFLYFLDPVYGDFRGSTYSLPSVGAFHHVAGSFRQADTNNVEVRIFVDGQLVKNELVQGNLARTVNANPVTIGADNETGYFFNGIMDEVSLYDRALTTNEIQAIYAAGAAGKCALAPAIVTQPKDQAVTEGEDVTFSVGVTGTSPLSYQWRFHQTNLAGANADSLTLNSVQFTNQGNYSVVISNSAGSVTSSNALLTVTAPPPCITSVTGLVSWWRGESNALDSVSTNNGTLANETAFASGKVGKAFVFDGDGDAVQLGNPAAMRLQDFTIECWIKRASATLLSPSGCGNGMIFGYGGGGYSLFLEAPGGSLGLTEVDVSNVNSGVSISDTNWHHVAVTKTGATVFFYLDGVAYAAPSYNPGFTFGTSLAIGARGDNLDCGFFGRIDEPAIYNRALSAGEVQAIYSAGVSGKCLLAPAILSHPQDKTTVVGDEVSFSVMATGSSPLSYQWRFNQTNIAGATSDSLALHSVQFTNQGNYSVIVSNSAGSVVSSNAFLTVTAAPPCITTVTGLVSWWRAEANALDSAGTNNGVLAGNTSYGAGRVGQAFALDGDGDGVSLGNPPELQVQNFTIEMWLKRASDTILSETATEAELFCYGGGGYGFGLDSGGNLFLTRVGVNSVGAGSGVTDTNWHHLAVTKAGTSVVFYIDGVAYPAPSYNSTFTFSTTVAIGARGDNFASSFLGSIDESSFYGRALSAGEIQAIYNASVSGKCLLPPAIVTHPSDKTAVVGDDVILQVTATGSSPLSYQWKFNQTNLAGATAALLTLNNVQFSNAGTYSVIVSNGAASVSSSNAVLTVNPPPPCTAPLTGLIGWWRGESNALDSIGTNNGTLTNQAAYTGGEAGSGFAFDGTTDAVQLGNSPLLQLQNFTIEAWIKRASTSQVSGSAAQDAVFFSYGSGGYGVGLTSAGVPLLTRIGVDARTAGPAISDTNWHHYAVTKAGTSLIFFVDGAAYPASAYSGVFTFSSPPAIGARGDNQGNSFLGAIDELSIYSRALTTNEIQAIYDARKSGKCALPVAPVIVAQPPNTNVLAGNSASFSVLAGGSVPLGYQWRFNGTNLAGRTDATLLLTNAQIGQAGSYSVEVTNAAGKASSSNATLTVTFPTAIIRAGATNVTAGWPVTVPVTLAANGNENGLGFSLNFNTQRLAFAGVTLGSGAAGASLLLNTSLTATGRLGVALAFPLQQTFTPGTQEVVRINFNSLPVLGASAVNATNSFADLPVLRELYDAQLQTLPAGFSNGVVTLLPTAYEGDVFPRPGGNQTVTATDWAQAGRFVACLDTAAAGTEFQRADCAPRATAGDGQLKVTDLVQAGRSLAGLDALLVIGGPTNETLVAASNAPVSRQLRVMSTNVLQSQSAIVPVLLEAQGDENALGFTFHFDPSVFAYGNLTLGSGAAGASLIANTSQAGAGQVGVVVALPAATTFGAGSRELVQISLVASSGSVGPSAVSLTDELVARSAADVLAGELPVNYMNGTVTIASLNPPTLSIAPSGTNVMLAWPLWAADFNLQTLGGTNGVQGDWSNLPVALQTNGSTVEVTLPLGVESRFFRLFHP